MTPIPTRLITLPLLGAQGQPTKVHRPDFTYLQLTEPELLELIRLCADALRSIYEAQPVAYHELVE